MMTNIATIFKNNNKICASIQIKTIYVDVFKAVIQRDLDVYVGYFGLGLFVY